jgi:hypothetical protein
MKAFINKDYLMYNDNKPVKYAIKNLKMTKKVRVDNKKLRVDREKLISDRKKLEVTVLFKKGHTFLNNTDCWVWPRFLSRNQVDMNTFLFNVNLVFGPI